MNLQLSDSAYRVIRDRWESLNGKDMYFMGISIGAWIPPESSLGNAIALGSRGHTELTQLAQEFSNSINMKWDIDVAAYTLDQIPGLNRLVVKNIPFYIPDELQSVFENATLDFRDDRFQIVRTS
jgi:hypothetical protein